MKRHGPLLRNQRTGQALRQSTIDRWKAASNLHRLSLTDPPKPKRTLPPNSRKKRRARYHAAQRKQAYWMDEVITRSRQIGERN